jgi:hypothetical protein
MEITSEIQMEERNKKRNRKINKGRDCKTKEEIKGGNQGKTKYLEM